MADYDLGKSTGDFSSQYSDSYIADKMNPYEERMTGAGMFGDLVRQLTGLGIGKSELAEGFSNLSKISGGDVSSALRKAFGIGESMPSSMFSQLTGQQLRGMEWGTYQPMLQQKQQTLKDELAQSLGSKKARQEGGGFAGSSAQQEYESRARDVYGQGMTGAIGDVAGLRTKAYSGVQSTIGDWLQQAQRFKTGG